eukprot:3051928-Rhodomonas_salina.1
MVSSHRSPRANVRRTRSVLNEERETGNLASRQWLHCGGTRGRRNGETRNVARKEGREEREGASYGVCQAGLSLQCDKARVSTFPHAHTALSTVKRRVRLRRDTCNCEASLSHADSSSVCQLETVLRRRWAPAAVGGCGEQTVKLEEVWDRVVAQLQL